MKDKKQLYKALIGGLTPSRLFVVLSVIGFISVVTVFFVSHGDAISHYFFYSKYDRVDDTGMDFFHSIEYLKGNQPYKLFDTLYPPLANLFFAFLFRLVPNKVTDNWTMTYLGSLSIKGTTDDLRMHQSTMVLFICFIIFTAIAVFAVVQVTLKGKGERTKLLVAAATVCSYPFLYYYERGNIMIIAWIFTLLFIILHDHENAVLREIGLISLAVAAGLKVYPAVYGLLLIQEKRLFAAVRTVIYGILSVVLPSLAFGEGLAGIKAWISVLINFSGNTVSGQSFNAFSTIRVISEACRLNFRYGIKAVLAKLICFVVLLCVLTRKNRRELVFTLTLLLAMYTGQGWSLMLIPLLMYFREEDHFTRDNAISIVGMIAVTINLPLLSVRDAEYGLILLILAGKCAFDLGVWTKEYLKNRKSAGVDRPFFNIIIHK